MNELAKEYKKNITDIDKILEIYTKNKAIKDNAIIKQLKSKRNSYVIKLYNLNCNYLFDNVIKITDMKIDYKTKSAMIRFKMQDGTITEQLYYIDNLRLKNKGENENG